MKMGPKFLIFLPMLIPGETAPLPTTQVAVANIIVMSDDARASVV